MCSYLHRRGAVYCTRLVVPSRLRSIIGKSDLGRSLRTKELAEAKRLLPSWLEEAQSILAAAQKEFARGSTRPAQAHTAPPYPLTQEQADWQEESDRFWQGVEREDEAKAEAEDVLLAKIDGPDSELTVEEAAAARLIKEAKRDRDRYRDRYRARKQRDQLNDGNVGFGRNEPARLSHTQQASGVSVSGMFEAYASQEGSKPDTVRQWRSIINHLIVYLGHDDAKAVGLPDLARWRENLRTEAVKDGKPRSAKTINDSYLAAANAVFTYGVNQLLTPANPATNLAKVRVPKAQKLREKDFTKAERKIILQAALVPASANLSPERVLARRWVPWLCAYTGARVNEITQLRKEDVQEIEGVWTVRITPEAGPVKTNEARTVPIHAHLIEQGFIDAIGDKPEGALFYKPDPAATSARGQHKQVGTFLAAWVRDLGVTDPAVRPNHGWRHTFKGICLEVGIEERAADYMQGHAPKGQGRRYGPNTIVALALQLTKFPRFDFS